MPWTKEEELRLLRLLDTEAPVLACCLECRRPILAVLAELHAWWWHGAPWPTALEGSSTWNTGPEVIP